MICALTTTSSRAESMYLVGTQSGANSSYTFLGAVITLPTSSFTDDFALRFWTDYLTYDYTSGIGKIEASAWGGELALVYQMTNSWGWSNFSVGSRYRDTKLSPDDFSNRARGGKFYGTAQFDGGYNFVDSFQFRWIMGYTTEIDGYYIQSSLDRAFGNNLRLGVDASFQGNDTYQENSIGTNATLIFSDSLNIGLRAGTTVTGASTGIYGGVVLIMFNN